MDTSVSIDMVKSTKLRYTLSLHNPEASLPRQQPPKPIEKWQNRLRQQTPFVIKEKKEHPSPEHQTPSNKTHYKTTKDDGAKGDKSGPLTSNEKEREHLMVI
ncbi:hypothetical protein FQA39_LY06917 [Lamprigera yunnana]|nr:hypothetical protein FQA39_LY06917 [Lamprigera yunnana]